MSSTSIKPGVNALYIHTQAHLYKFIGIASNAPSHKHARAPLTVSCVNRCPIPKKVRGRSWDSNSQHPILSVVVVTGALATSPPTASNTLHTQVEVENVCLKVHVAYRGHDCKYEVFSFIRPDDTMVTSLKMSLEWTQQASDGKLCSPETCSGLPRIQRRLILECMENKATSFREFNGRFSSSISQTLDKRLAYPPLSFCCWTFGKRRGQNSELWNIFTLLETRTFSIPLANGRCSTRSLCEAAPCNHSSQYSSDNYQF